MRVPAHISFEDRYVLSIKIEPYNVIFEVDLVLLPEHELYRQPMKGQRECFCKGQLRIDGFDRILWNATKLLPSVDVTGELDFGSFDQIVDANMSVRFFVVWGELEIFGGTLSVRNIRGEGKLVEKCAERFIGAGIFRSEERSVGKEGVSKIRT